MRLTFYFEISKAIKFEKKVSRTIFKCQTENCFEQKNNSNSLKFCSECGTPIMKKEEDVVVVKDHISPYDFCEEHFGEHDERVCSDNGGLPDNIWLWNYYLPKELKKYEVRSDDLDINNDIAIDLSKVNTKKAIEEFLLIDKVNELISKFEQIYGEDSIKARYGIVCPIY